MPPVSSLFIWLENPSITQIRVWIALGTEERLRKALELIQAQLQGTEALHNTCQTIELMALKSVTLKKLRRNDEALSVLGKVLELAGPDGWIQPFLELGSIMKDLLVQLQDQKTFADFIAKLLNAFQKIEIMAKTVPGSEADLGSSSVLETLTTREKEILGLLANGQANKEIEENLFISIDTVKTHLKKIFQKLEVNSRLQAVTKANALGVVQKRKL